MKNAVIFWALFFVTYSGIISAAESNYSQELLSKRYSGYSFDASRKVSHEQLLSILEAGRLAPSSYNDQPWYFIVCDKNTNPEAYQKAFSTLVEFNQGWAKTAPVLLIVIANDKSHQGQFNRWAQYDTGAAAFSIMLQATSLGLMAHQMGGFDEQKVRQLFSLPEHAIPMSVMAIGYAAPGDKKKEKERKPLRENFFDGAWGRGI